MLLFSATLAKIKSRSVQNLPTPSTLRHSVSVCAASPLTPRVWTFPNSLFNASHSVPTVLGRGPRVRRQCLCSRSLMHTHKQPRSEYGDSTGSNKSYWEWCHILPFPCLRTTNHLLPIFNTYPHPSLGALSAKYPQVGDSRRNPSV